MEIIVSFKRVISNSGDNTVTFPLKLRETDNLLLHLPFLICLGFSSVFDILGPAVRSSGSALETRPAVPSTKLGSLSRTIVSRFPTSDFCAFFLIWSTFRKDGT